MGYWSGEYINIIHIFHNLCDIFYRLDNETPSSSIVQVSFPIHTINGDNGDNSPSPHIVTRSKNSPIPKPLSSEQDNNIGKKNIG